MELVMIISSVVAEEVEEDSALVGEKGGSYMLLMSIGESIG